MSPKISVPRALVADIARESGLTRQQVRTVLTAAFTHLRASAAERPVRVLHFGTFYLQTRRGGVRPHPRYPQRMVEVPDMQRIALRSNYEPMTPEESAQAFPGFIPEQEVA